MGNKQNATTVVKNIKDSEYQSAQRQKIKEKQSSSNGVVDKNNFDFLYVIGRGGFGKVKYIFIIFIIGLESFFQKI